MPEGVLPPELAARLGELLPASRSHWGLDFHLTRDRADIDISGGEFDFVRSIRVFHVQYASQYQAGREGNCERAAQVLLGSYGVHGEFSWQGSSIEALPERHEGLDQWGAGCTRIDHRSVFVDWRDYEGEYGFEQVNY